MNMYHNYKGMSETKNQIHTWINEFKYEFGSFVGRVRQALGERYTEGPIIFVIFHFLNKI